MSEYVNATRRCECGGRILATDESSDPFHRATVCEDCGKVGLERLSVDNWPLECFECRALFDDFDGPPAPTECPECREQKP